MTLKLVKHDPIDLMNIWGLICDIEKGETLLHLVGDAPEDIYAGNVEYKTADGWKVWVFNDCGDWDYFDAFETPEGVRIEFEDCPDDIQNYRPDSDIRDSRYHWTPHGYSIPPKPLDLIEFASNILEIKKAGDPWSKMALGMARQMTRQAISKYIFALFEWTAKCAAGEFTAMPQIAKGLTGLAASAAMLKILGEE